MACPVDSCETQIGNLKSFPFVSEICIDDCNFFFKLTKDWQCCEWSVIFNQFFITFF